MPRLAGKCTQSLRCENCVFSRPRWEETAGGRKSKLLNFCNNFNQFWRSRHCSGPRWEETMCQTPAWVRGSKTVDTKSFELNMSWKRLTQMPEVESQNCSIFATTLINYFKYFCSRGIKQQRNESRTHKPSVQGALNKFVDCGQKGIYFNYFSSRCIKQIRWLWAKGDLLQLLLFKVH